MLTYDIPVGKDWRGMTLYNVPEDDLVRMLRVVYGKDGTLQNITTILGGHETLLYIRYENEESKKLFNALKKCFRRVATTTVNGYFIGPRTYKNRKTYRFCTISIHSPPLYDLPIP